MFWSTIWLSLRKSSCGKWYFLLFYFVWLLCNFNGYYYVMILIAFSSIYTTSFNLHVNSFTAIWATLETISGVKEVNGVRIDGRGEGCVRWCVQRVQRLHENPSVQQPLQMNYIWKLLNLLKSNIRLYQCNI
jgi:hypothetical protein